MVKDDFDTAFYSLQIRRLAARHQAGEKLSEIKASVDSLLFKFELFFRKDSDYQVKRWDELFVNLSEYVTKYSDPDWLTVISYARRQVSRKKGTAHARHKQVNARNL